MNAKGGMDDKEFLEFMKNSIFPLYPFARDKPGHRVMLKVDSGPGRNFLELLAECRAMLHMSPTCHVVSATGLQCHQFLTTCPMSRGIY
jgi:hypothetical protein